MSFTRVATRLALVAAALAMTIGAEAQTSQSPPMVEWVVPVLKTNKPQTADEAEAGRQRGRELPPPEVLQPTLDPALSSYRPRSDAKLTGTFKGAASDVMVAIAQKCGDVLLCACGRLRRRGRDHHLALQILA